MYKGIEISSYRASRLVLDGCCFFKVYLDLVKCCMQQENEPKEIEITRDWLVFPALNFCFTEVSVLPAVAIWVPLLLYQRSSPCVFKADLGVCRNIICHYNLNLFRVLIYFVPILFSCNQFCRFAGQFLCSYSTLPLYALVTQVISDAYDWKWLVLYVNYQIHPLWMISFFLFGFNTRHSFNFYELNWSCSFFLPLSCLM